MVPTRAAPARVLVILPCKGREDQTLRYADRLRVAAGGVEWEKRAHWAAVGGADEGTLLRELWLRGWDQVGGVGPGYTYWEALLAASLRGTVNGQSPPVLCAVANDCWAWDGWLARGLAAYDERFPDGEGLMGFGGDRHGVEHSCHFLIGRGLLRQLGGWPIWYRHNFGDTELCARARALGRYGKALGAVLEHRHVWHGTADDDPVYARGRSTWDQDLALFTARQARGWR